MPNKKHQAKHMRQSERRRDRNRADKSTFRSALKATEKAVVEGNVAETEKSLAETLRVVGKTQKKGLIHKNKAARHASRLTRKLNALKAKGTTAA